MTRATTRVAGWHLTQMKLVSWYFILFVVPTTAGAHCTAQESPHHTPTGAAPVSLADFCKRERDDKRAARIIWLRACTAVCTTKCAQGTDTPTGPPDGHFAISHHSDAGAVTVLLMDGREGLQVEPEEAWQAGSAMLSNLTGHLTHIHQLPHVPTFAGMGQTSISHSQSRRKALEATFSAEKSLVLR